ncbi:uncharacterized protein E0L32_008224 [Thyridium curvatum]|uniref:Uncharacterized protein n=1 Tax=Thyridium curvatum TaxID=1093900 RepID=A0A507AK74_9PEZI|nr:uncharacterized protein E0L32_008224 [Thyridium curvatum]TPX10835.1 hypothetical protein E0L32_008224 [Thyridium curvatum]
MKFTTALVTLAAGASAMPWASHFGTGKHHRNTKDDVTVHIKVDQSPVRSSKLHASNFEICWLVCWPEAPTCPDGWVRDTAKNAPISSLPQADFAGLGEQTVLEQHEHGPASTDAEDPESLQSGGHQQARSFALTFVRRVGGEEVRREGLLRAAKQQPRSATRAARDGSPLANRLPRAAALD